MIKATSERHMILVLGMHRSGTSIITRAVSALGATLPDQLLGPTSFNKEGHFEPSLVVSLQERILASAGMTWWSWEEFPNDWYRTDLYVRAKTELAGVIEKIYQGETIMVIKDPRTCRLLRLWKEVLSEQRIKPYAVVPFRNPCMVARSLQDRDKIEPQMAMLLWLRYVLEVEVNTRDLNRVFVQYEAFTKMPEYQLQRIQATLLAPWIAPSLRDLTEVVSLVTRPSKSQVCDLSKRADVIPWVRVAFDAYRDLVANASDLRVGRLFDEVRGLLNQASAIFGPLSCELQGKLLGPVVG